jgi:hypothetical protein
MTDPELSPVQSGEPCPTVPAAPRDPCWGYPDVLMLVGLAVPLMLIAAGAVKGVEALVTGKWNPALAAIAVQFGFWGLWFGAVYGVLRLEYCRPFWRSLGFLRPPRGFSYAALMGAITALLSVLLSALLRPPDIKTPLDELMQGRLALTLIVIFGVTLAPLCEELAFRGLLLPLLARSTGAAAGVLLTAVPFALLHGSEYAWSWQRLAVIFFAGAAFGWLRLKTGSTAASAVMHATYNLIFFVGFFYQKAVGIH